LLGRVWPVDAVGVDERAASLAKRSIKKDAKLWALDLAIRMMDLTTLEGKDTPGKVRALAAKARRPDPTDPSIPSVAALCVYPNQVVTARDALAGWRTCGPPWRSAPTRSTWSSTVVPSSPATTPPSTTRSPR
jgi:hypothetical protein